MMHCTSVCVCVAQMVQSANELHETSCTMLGLLLFLTLYIRAAKVTVLLALLTWLLCVCACVRHALPDYLYYYR